MVQLLMDIPAARAQTRTILSMSRVKVKKKDLSALKNLCIKPIMTQEPEPLTRFMLCLLKFTVSVAFFNEQETQKQCVR